MTSTTIRRRKATATPEQRAERAAAQAARLADLHEHIAAGVEALTSTDEWRAILDTARRFHTYSPTNQLLIYVQRPDATRVAGFTTWQALGRQVRKGEKGIAILAPCPRRGGGEDTTPATPDAPGESGEGSGAGRGGRMRFTVAHVFDESQTDGDDLPEVLPTLLEGEGPAGLWDGLAAQATGHGYTIERGPCGEANGYTNPADHLVRVRDDVSNAQACKTLAHELAHIVCGHVEDLTDYVAHRGRAEVEAESVAYIVSGAQGMNTSDYTFGYVAHWAQGHPEQVRATVDTVLAAARTILDNLPTGVGEQDEPA